MGCDIHAVLEKKHEGAWVGVHAFPYLGEGVEISAIGKEIGYKHASWFFRNRSYTFFGEIAGVRAPSSTSLEPRGVPDDASELARMELAGWDGDAHTHTWATPKECAQAWIRSRQDGFFETDKTVRLLDNGSLEDSVCVHLFGLYPDENPEEHRLVIWFDN